MDREEKKRLRGILFRHLDGIAMTSTVKALNKIGIIKFILEHPTFHFIEINSAFKTNDGYLNVALRILASQGWIKRDILMDGQDLMFSITEKGQNPRKIGQKIKSH